MKGHHFSIAIVTLLFYILPGCRTIPEPEIIPTTAPDMHTSEISLDWAGTYTGSLPCEDCTLYAELKLKDDLTFVYNLLHTGQREIPLTMEGEFRWRDDGNSIELLIPANITMPLIYSVGENRILQHDVHGNPVSPEIAHMYMLSKRETQILDTRWKLTELSGNPVPGDKNLSHEPFVVFSSENNRVTGNGSCNSFFGMFELGQVNHISITGIGATKMLCSEMEVETRLFKVLEHADNYFLSGDTLILARGSDHPLAKFINSSPDN